MNIIGEMSSGFNFGQAVRIARDSASAFGDAAAAAKYGAAFTAIQAAFHKQYWDATNATYGDGTQAALVYALYLQAVPDNMDAAVLAKLIALINTGTKECDSTPCLDTGIIATKWLMEVLSNRGRTDVGLQLAFKTDFPSWGYMASQNATTIWEHWEYMNGPGMNSHAHPALASVGAWFYRWVAGLRLDDGSLATPNSNYGKGWRTVLFSPACITDPRLPSASARVTSMYGAISASWHATAAGKAVTMMLSIPTDVSARVVVPASVGSGSGGAATVTVMEGGTAVWQGGKAATPGVAGVHAVEVAGQVTITVGAGVYAFDAK